MSHESAEEKVAKLEARLAALEASGSDKARALFQQIKLRAQPPPNPLAAGHGE